jgi:ABC-type Zn uptake system ZnuABC Zn-binding protein ZnuA
MMLGGTRLERIADAAVIAQEKALAYPLLTISGTKVLVVAATSPDEEPDMPPKRKLATQLT